LAFANVHGTKPRFSLLAPLRAGMVETVTKYILQTG